MLITDIKLNEEKVDKRNKLVDIMFERGDVKDTSLKVKDVEDILVKYDKWKQHIIENKNYKLIDEKDISYPVIVTGLNFSMKLESLTDIKVKKNYENGYYGLCDNAEQVIKYYESLIANKELYMFSNYIITLTPMIKEAQPERDGFRFHKWGQYLGVQDIESYEYIYDSDIDLIYSFHIYQIKGGEVCAQK